MMKSVLFSINRPHTDNIKIYAKKSELRTRPPKIKEPYKAYIYETIKNGGCGKVIGEFTAFNEFTYRMCMGVPKHLVLSGCISAEEIWAYTNNGEKDLTEISISDLVIYDEPRELSEFFKIGHSEYCKEKWQKRKDLRIRLAEYNRIMGEKAHLNTNSEFEANLKLLSPFKMKRPPQSWCYVESEVQGE